MAATTPAIIWLIKDCMPKIANANGWKGEGGLVRGRGLQGMV